MYFIYSLYHIDKYARASQSAATNGYMYDNRARQHLSMVGYGSSVMSSDNAMDMGQNYNMGADYDPFYESTTQTEVLKNSQTGDESKFD